MERNLLGTVVSDFSKTRRFKVHLKQGSEIVVVQIDEELPVKKFDLFSGFCKLDGKTWVPIEKPFFTPHPTKTSIQNAFKIALKGKLSPIIMSVVYDGLVSVFGNPRGVANFMCRYSYEYSQGEPLGGNDVHFNNHFKQAQLTQILKWWNWNWSRRSLLLLGLKSDDIENLTRFSYHEFHKLLTDNPIEAYEVDMDLTLEIAERLGMEISPKEQFMGAVPRFIHSCCRYRKWVGVPLENLLATFENLQEDTQLLIQITKRFQIVFDQESQMLLLEHQAKVQQLLADRFQTLAEFGKLPRPQWQPDFLLEILAEEQKQAVIGALNSSLSIIVGPAGSGKTCVIRELVHNLKLQERKYALVAFTGKAVSRIRQATDEEASTMDRMIHCESAAKFETLIIDEAGMVSNELLYRFLKTFTHNFNIILIGDPYQLQPLSWGCAFKQLIDFIQTFRLTQNHRLVQVDSENNSLPQNIDDIIYDPDYLPDCSETFEIDPPENQRAIQSIQALVKMIADEEQDPNCVTVLCPYRAGGDLKQINQMVSAAFNGANEEIVDSLGETFRIGDRVKMCKNDHSRQIYNGEEGIVTEIKDNKVRVQFAANLVHDFETFMPRYSMTNQPLNTGKLRLSFAKTVHEDQGDEHNYVILWIPYRKHSRAFLNQSLIYTAVTRAKMAFYCIGDTEEFKPSARAHPPIRHDNLRSEMEKL